MPFLFYGYSTIQFKCLLWDRVSQYGGGGEEAMFNGTMSLSSVTRLICGIT